MNTLGLTKTIGIFGVPFGLRPPRLTVTPPIWLKRLTTVRVEKPEPFTVTTLAPWLTEVIETFAPIGTDTALLDRLNLPSEPLLVTTKEPGPVAGD